MAYNNVVDVAPILSVSALTVVVKDSQAVLVKDFALSLRSGEITAIVGESGSGKSIACLAIMQLLQNGLERTAGSVKFNNTQLGELPESELQKYRGKSVAYVFQDPASSLNPVLSIYAHFNEVFSVHFSQLTSPQKKQRSSELLAEVGLSNLGDIKNRYAHQLSGGQQQRLLLALSLASNPQVLIADEITTALDPDVQQMIIDLLAKLCLQRNLAVAFITHDIHLAQQISTNIAVMHQTRIVEFNDCQSLFDYPQHPATIKLLGAARREAAIGEEVSEKDLVLDAIDLSISYRIPRIFGRARRVQVVKDISFKIFKGQTLAIVGKSGSGKSTIARAVCGLAHHLEGQLNLYLKNEVVHLHQSDQRALRPYRKHVSMVFQDPVASLNPLVPVHKSVAEPLLVHTDMNAEQRLQCATKLLAEVGLDSGQIVNRLPSELSVGQCQRVAIARALALDPLLMVCDEALASLDLTAQREITDLLLSLQQKRQLCLLFISHDYKLVQGIAHNIFSLDEHVALAQ